MESTEIVRTYNNYYFEVNCNKLTTMTEAILGVKLTLRQIKTMFTVVIMNDKINNTKQKQNAGI